MIDLSSGTALHDNSFANEHNGDAYEVPWATGAAVMLRADLIERLRDSMNDTISAGDVDLSLRAVGEGYKVVVVHRRVFIIEAARRARICLGDDFTMT